MSRVLPILFNTEMVRAILDNRKTVTRRICKDGNIYTVPDMDFYDADRRTYAVHNYADKEHRVQLSTAERSCPICPGDILYVRETWCRVGEDVDKMYFEHSGAMWDGMYLYKADGTELSDIGKWHPSLHMPKDAARIWLKVTDVRVEHLQDITEDEAKAEGANWKNGKNVGWEEKMKRTAVDRFAEIWNSTIKKSDLERCGWYANPWVWVIEFERCENP